MHGGYAGASHGNHAGAIEQGRDAGERHGNLSSYDRQGFIWDPGGYQAAQDLCSSMLRILNSGEHKHAKRG